MHEGPNHRTWLRGALLLALLAPCLHAQAGEPPLPPPPVPPAPGVILKPKVIAFGGGLPSPTPRFDPAPTLQYLVATVRGEEATLPLATASWIALAFLANGSTLRQGPHKKPLMVLTMQLRSSIDEQGWFRAAGGPVTRADQVLATLALAETTRASQYKLLQPTAERASAAVAADLLIPDRVAPKKHEFLLVQLLTECPTLDGARLAKSKELLVAAGRGLVAGKDRGTDAVLHLASLLQGAKHPAALTVAKAWPANPAADPWHTLAGLCALQRTDPTTWATETEALTRLLAARTTTGPEAGSWPAVAGLDALTTTAMFAVVLGTANQWPLAEPGPSDLGAPHRVLQPGR